MPTESFELVTILPAPPDRVYRAWLDGKQHSDFTGSRAIAQPTVGSSFSAWDDYITGTNLELEPARRIVQEWRTTEFPDEAEPSRLELVLQPTDEGTMLTLRHTEIPEGQGESYKQGWEDHYFHPMRQYFEAVGSEPAPAAQAEGHPGVGRRTEEKMAEARRIQARPAPQKAAPKKAPAKKAPAKKAAAKKAAGKRPAKKKPAARKAKKPARASKRKPAKKKSRR